MQVVKLRKYTFWLNPHGNTPKRVPIFGAMDSIPFTPFTLFGVPDSGFSVSSAESVPTLDWHWWSNTQSLVLPCQVVSQ
jgi:hypothetical protein